MSDKVIKIVFTGGPCGGKSTAIAEVQKRFTKLGYVVLVCCEAATALGDAGMSPAEYGSTSYFQEIILRKIIQEEDLLCEALLKIPSDKPRILLCDRGVKDGEAYVGEDSFHACIKGMGLSVVELRDRRYDGVIHLVTAADGAGDYYTTANNEMRHESPELARELDRKTMHAWVGCPHLCVIDNSTNFELKLDRVMGAVSHVVGIPQPQEIERKFLVHADFSLKDMCVPYQTINIVQLYLADMSRIRLRSQYGHHICFHTRKEFLNSRKRNELERILFQEEYMRLQLDISPEHVPIVKDRSCFVSESQYFELDFFQRRNKLKLLELELLHEDQPILLPEFIPIVREVTDETEFSNVNLAKAY